MVSNAYIAVLQYMTFSLNSASIICVSDQYLKLICYNWKVCFILQSLTGVVGKSQ